MNTRFLLSLISLALVGVASVASGAPAKARSTSDVKSDLAAVEQRQTVVALANRLSQPAELPTVPDDLKSPFTPAGFDKPDPVEKRGLPSTALANNAAAPVPRRCGQTLDHGTRYSRDDRLKSAGREQPDISRHHLFVGQTPQWWSKETESRGQADDYDL